MPGPLLVATRKGLFVFDLEREDAAAAVHFLGMPVTAVLPAAEARWYAALNLGHFGAKLHRTDNGADFRELPCPAFPPRPPDFDDRDPMRNQPVPWTVQQIWVLESGGGPDELWCGTIPGGLFHSADGGERWTLVEGLWHHPDRRRWFGGGYDFAGIHSICIDPRDPQVVLVAVSCGGLWRSTDGGSTWHSHGRGLQADYMPPAQAEDPVAQDPHRLVQCRGAPDTLWIQHHSGIFRSDDGGARWERLHGRPSSFGFAVAVHPDDPAQAWFVPAQRDQCRVPVDARFGVMHTADGGAGFEWLTEGLPDGPAFHLVYRHGLDVDADGRRLAMGSTTGSLWLSDDGGVSWRRLSADLPPINAVRFCP